MSISISSNVSAMQAARNTNINNRALQKNIAHLSSGSRISDASDDAAGLAISQQQKSDVGALNQAARNANDGVSMTQVAGGAMSSQASILTRMKELAVQAMNGTYSASQVSDTNTEFQSLVNEVDRIASATNFNGVSMLSAGSTTNFQVGADTTTGNSIAVTFSKTDKTTLGIGSLDLTAAGGASTALTAINSALDTLSTAQATVGAAQNQLQSAADNATSESTNLSASVSQISDVDIASESTALSQNNTLVQAGEAVLAQANQQPSQALSLLRG